MVLPVWYNIDAQEVRNYSPLLAARYAARSSDGMDKVVTDLLRVLRPETASEIEALAPLSLTVATFREQIIEFVKDARTLVLMYGASPSDDEQYAIIMAYGEMGLRYHAIKHHLESKLGYRRVETLAKLPVPTSRQVILRTADLLENLAMDVPEYLPAFPVELDSTA